MLKDKDEIKVNKLYLRSTGHYASILAKQYGLPKKVIKSILIHGWRRMLRLMRNGRNDFRIQNFGHIYAKKYQKKLLRYSHYVNTKKTKRNADNTRISPKAMERNKYIVNIRPANAKNTG